MTGTFADMTVAEMGEFGLISELTAALPLAARQGSGTDLGIGDDAASWMPTPGSVSVITTDALIEGIHFRLDWTDWKSLGFKSLAVNLSDIAAMGAQGRLVTVTLGLRGSERVADLRALYEGLGELATVHGVMVAGGDVVRSPERLIISVTAIGEVRPDELLKRSGARSGDLVVVSGTLGASAAGMELIAHTDRYGSLTTAGLLIAAHLRPNPRLALGSMLARAGVTSCMDLSDGLLGDLPKILAASCVGAEIDSRRIPVAPALRAIFPDRWLEFAMRGGEDYELLFTIPSEHFDRLHARADSVGATVTAIGAISDAAKGFTLVDMNGGSSPVTSGAFDHFRR